MHYGTFEERIVKATPIEQMMALDMETQPPAEKPEELLMQPRQIIGIGAMYFTDKEPNLFIAEDEGAEYEPEMLSHFNDFIKSRRPLLVVGYGITILERPLLTLKMKTEYRDRRLWAINDMIERAYFLGLAHTIRFYLHNKGYIEKPSFMDFDTVIEHPAFRDLPLRREEKKLAPRGKTFIEKGRKISKLWKEEREKFRRYLISDVYNCFVLCKFIYQL